MSTASKKIPRWVAVFEEEATKPLQIIGLKRDDIRQATRDYRLMADMFDACSTIRDAAVRFLSEAQGKTPDPVFDPLNMRMVIDCIDHHAHELWRLRAENERLRSLIDQQVYKGPLPRPACDCKGWGCWGCCDTEDQIASKQGSFS